MAVSAEQLKSVFPEFKRASTAMIEEMIAQAARSVDSAVFGDRTDDAVLWKSAHLLATSPFGRAAKLVEKDGGTTYYKNYMLVVHECAGGFRVV